MVESSLYHLSYAISKQLPTAYSLDSSYGELELDDEMRAAIEKALLPILEKRLNSTPEPEIITTSSSPEPEHYNFKNCNLAGQQKVIFCKSCGKQLTPFQVETYLITRADDPDRGLCSDCSCPDPRKKYGSAIIEKNLRALKKF